MLRRYERGKASVSFGNVTVTGFDTSWLTYVSAGDILHVGETEAIIQSIEKINSLTLAETWVGDTVTDGAYWVEINPDNMTRARAAKKRWIEQTRLRKRYDNVFALGYEWQADASSQDLLGKTMLNVTLGLPLPPVWRDFFNVDMPLTDISQLVAIAGVIGEQTQNAYITSWILKAQVDAAATVEELTAIIWP